MLHNGCSVTGVAAAAVSRELPPCCGLMLTQAGVKPGPGPGSDTDGADQDAVQLYSHCTATVQYWASLHTIDLNWVGGQVFVLKCAAPICTDCRQL